MKKRLVVLSIGVFALFGMALASFAASSYTESTDGDLSNDGAAPTMLTFSAGDNTINGSTGAGDRDYVALEIPDGHELTSLTLNSYSGFSVSFIGVVSGTSTTVDPDNADPADLLGYYLFGGGDVGSDILSFVGSGTDAMGFTPPLAAGTYTFWIQETGGSIDYEFNFEVTSTETPASPGHSEGSDGDLSSDGAMPTEVTVEVGENTVAGSTGAGDRDYLTIEVPAGHQLSSIRLDAYDGFSVSFIAVVTGTETAVDPENADAADLLGYYLFGGGDVNFDLLASMGDASDAMGFEAPLGPGNYTFWIQETGGGINYEMAFIIGEIPAAHHETNDGDLSNDGANPTSATLAAGDNLIAGNTGPGDRDFITFSVPAGHELSALMLDKYTGDGIQSFLGIVNGTELGVDPGLAQESDLLGYYLLNTGAVGSDILPDIGQGSGAQGFTPALPAGDYTIWLQELSGPNVDYEITLQIQEATTPFVPTDFIYLPIIR